MPRPRAPVQALLISIGVALSLEADPGFSAGAVRVDITPGYPVRLSGYGGRRDESSGVAQRIFARALALGEEGAPPAVLVAVENLGVPDRVVTEVAGRVEKKAGVPRERFALASTHTHSAPMLSGICETLFGVDIPPEHQASIDQYTRELTDLLEKAALDALEARAPARLEWGRGKAGFAGNRRTKGGPVDHELPLLRALNAAGGTIAVVAGYACHCTALGGDFNQVCGDWAGFASEMIESRSPGSVALVLIGCGGDADPYPRTGLDLAKRHGQEIAAEAERLLTSGMKPLSGKLEGRFRRVELPFAPHPERKEWERRAKDAGAVGHHARRQLARLDRSEALQTHVSYPVETWTFGDDLAIVFLAGEVVVDYSLRLKRDLDGSRLWVAAYANDVPGYIPSRRILSEGGYEGGGAMIYYDRPGPFDASVEEKIIDTVRAMVPRAFQSGDAK